MSYMGPGAAMPGLYDIQNKSIPPEQLIYLSGQMPGGVSVHPQYLPQSLAHQFSVRQGTVSTNKIDNPLILFIPSILYNCRMSNGGKREKNESFMADKEFFEEKE